MVLKSFDTVIPCLTIPVEARRPNPFLGRPASVVKLPTTTSFPSLPIANPVTAASAPGLKVVSTTPAEVTRAK